MSWSKNLVQERVTIFSDEDSDEERGGVERLPPSFSTSSDNSSIVLTVKGC